MCTPIGGLDHTVTQNPMANTVLPWERPSQVTQKMDTFGIIEAVNCTRLRSVNIQWDINRKIIKDMNK